MKKVIAGIAVCVALSACSPGMNSLPSKPPAPTVDISNVTILTVPVAQEPSPPLLESVRALRVSEERPQGYKRSLFTHWIDGDGDGCDTRAEVLFSEAVEAPKVDKNCKISGGAWFSPYDQIRVTNAGELDLDHVVGLAEAWQSGADTWKPEQRRAFANDLDDPRTLVAVTASVNRSKNSFDPAEWLPPVLAARCVYISDWVAVKTRWDLAVDQREKDVLLQWATTCQ